MRFLRWWGPVLMWMFVIFVFSGRQRIVVSDEQVINFLFFKTLHVFEYAFLYLLSFRAVRNTFSHNRLIAWYITAFAITISYAFTDELHQTFVLTREGRLRDVIIDGIGATGTWFLIGKLLPKAPRRLQQLAKNWQLL